VNRDNVVSSNAYPPVEKRYIRPAFENKTLLWVDDYEPALAMYKTLFGLSGFQVLTASSGKRALELLKKHDVDAVITDYEMPCMDGAAVAHAVKQLRPTLPVIMFSGSVDVQDRVTNVVDAFCDKAESRHKLLAVINDLVCQEMDKEGSASLIAASAVRQEAASRLAS
jgi:CheY-like chemotaxis protein